MTPAATRALAFARDQFRRVRDAARRHPYRAALLLPALVLLYVLVLIPFTPSVNDLRRAKSEVPARVLSSDGVVLAEYKRINRQWVTLKKISPHVVNALIATEDHRFYQHHGIDFRRTGAAALATLSGNRQGGSTITQQLARNMYPEEIGRALSVNRKVKEAITALKIESVYTKDEILETYLNTVPFLYNAFGIEMAARTYFDKTADKLDVLESATLVGMLKGTSYYNPVLNPERALGRRNLVLAQMAKHGKLDPAKVQALAARPLRIDFERQVEPLGPAPHVAQHLRKWLIEWADRRGYDIHADGLVVRTTIDSKLQKAANQAVARQIAQLQKLVDARRKAGEERTDAAGRLPGAGPAQRFRAGLGRQPGLRNGTVRPCEPGAPPAGLHVQALRVRRRIRAGLSAFVHADRPARVHPDRAAKSGHPPTPSRPPGSR